MKIFTPAFIALVSLAIVTTAHAEHVSGYTRRDGTYVRPYERSQRDGTVTNNYSYQGNTNPYTGQVGSNRYEHDRTSPYFSGPDSHGRVGHDINPLGNETLGGN